MTGRDDLLRFLETDERDAGCERTLELLHVYVELVLAGEDPELTYPGITVHLRNCGPCAEDLEGLLAAAGLAGEQDGPSRR
jgi:hypothetical protein